MSDYDVAVIGSGLAGLAARWSALTRGLKPVVVSKDMGASQHFSGAFDIVDPRWAAPQLLPRQYPTVKSALEDFIIAHPQHIYARLAVGKQDFARNVLDAAAGFFQFYDIPILSDDFLLVAIGSAGRVKPTGFAIKTQALTKSEIAKHQSVVLVGVPALKEYPIETIANELKTHFQNVNTIYWRDFEPNPTSPLASLVMALDEPECFAKLKKFIAANKREATLIVLPPVLGVKNYLYNHAELERDLGMRVVEMLSVLPSVSGLRLAEHVREHFCRYPEDKIEGDVVQAIKSTDSIERIMVKDRSGVTKSICADLYVLATGKYLGGGIRREGSFIETVFDLPLSAKGMPVSKTQNISSFLQTQARAPQDFLDVGVDVDARCAPLQNKKVVLGNVRVCGQVVSGSDFTRDRCGFGVSLTTATAVFSK